MNNFYVLFVVVNEIGQQVFFYAFYHHSWSRDLTKFFHYTAGVIVLLKVASVIVISSMQWCAGV